MQFDLYEQLLLDWAIAVDRHETALVALRTRSDAVQTRKKRLARSALATLDTKTY